MMQRFREGEAYGDLVVLPDYDLFDTNDYVTEDEDLVEIGGEKYGDLPLTKYLPELKEKGVQEEIQREGIELT